MIAETFGWLTIIIAAGINLFLACRLIRRNQRIELLLARHTALVSAADEKVAALAELETLLLTICFSSIRRENLPAWAAWHGTMGVVFLRKLPSEDDVTAGE